jgi:hypothetical protein
MLGFIQLHSLDSASPDLAASRRLGRVSGGRTWWAHFEFTRIDIELIILRKKIEDVRQLGAFVFQLNVLSPSVWSAVPRGLFRVQDDKRIRP